MLGTCSRRSASPLTSVRSTPSFHGCTIRAVAVPVTGAPPPGGWNDAVICASPREWVSTRPLAVTVAIASGVLVQVTRPVHAGTVKPIRVMSVTTPSSNSANRAKRGAVSGVSWTVIGLGVSQMRSTLSVDVHPGPHLGPRRRGAVFRRRGRLHEEVLDAGARRKRVVDGDFAGVGIERHPERVVPGRFTPEEAGGDANRFDRGVATTGRRGRRGLGVRTDGNGVAVVVDLDVVDVDVAEEVGGGVAGQEVRVETETIRQRDLDDAVSDERQTTPPFHAARPDI